jgi:glycosyltransferase involved in cell wall biosynthesis
MNMGVPVISSDGGALPEVVGEAGIIVPLGNSFVSNLSRAMEKVISDKKLQKNLISMGYDRVKEFSWQREQPESAHDYG